MKRVITVMALALIAAAFAFFIFRSTPRPDIGFFSPSGVPEELVKKTRFAAINPITPAQLDDNLQRIRRTSFRLSIDLGSTVNPAEAPTAKLSLRYKAPDGLVRTKAFAPQKNSKILAIPADAVLRERLAPFLDVMARYPRNIGTLFLADEPYLNGITKTEMERAGKLVRRELDVRGLRKVKLGVIFSGGMFDSQFAHMIDERSGAYVRYIYNHHEKSDSENPNAFQAWVNTINTNRLATYDRAGNMYVDGGLPRGFDVYGFDFYLSTMLLDSLHEHTLDWLAKHYPQYGCSQFADQSMTRIRSCLSFFHDGFVQQGEQYRIKDREILDAIYECRMGAVTTMLKKAASDSRAQLLMISESSNNGVFEFDPAGNIKPEQPDLLVESRVLDEVRRAQSFYERNANTYSAGLLYFTYKNEYDSSIKLHIGGASAMPSVLTDIYRFAAGTPSTAESLCLVRRLPNR